MCQQLKNQPQIHQGPGIDEPIAMLRDLNKNEKFESDEIFIYTKDHLGSVRDITNNNGELVQRYDYTSYGITKLEKDPANQNQKFIENNYTYTAQDYDVETGLTRHGFRYYDSQSGRWISPDPIGLDGGDANYYRYVLNSPLMYTDPYGECLIALAVPPASLLLLGAATFGTAYYYSLTQEERMQLAQDLINVFSQQKGERGKAGSAKGTDNPFKHVRPHPDRPWESNRERYAYW